MEITQPFSSIKKHFGGFHFELQWNLFSQAFGLMKDWNLEIVCVESQQSLAIDFRGFSSLPGALHSEKLIVEFISRKISNFVSMKIEFKSYASLEIESHSEKIPVKLIPDCMRTE